MRRFTGTSQTFLDPARRLILEVDGYGTHGTWIAFQDDRTRQNVLVANGYTVLRYTAHDVQTRLGSILREITEMVRRLSPAIMGAAYVEVPSARALTVAHELLRAAATTRLRHGDPWSWRTGLCPVMVVRWDAVVDDPTVGPASVRSAGAGSAFQ